MLLAHKPDTATIMALRGRIDVYELKGVGWVGRGWPMRKAARTAGEVEASAVFAAMAVLAGAMDGTARAPWQEFMAGAHGATWVDAHRATATGHPWIWIDG